MRVLFMNSMKASGWRGGEKWMLEAASGLASRGHAVFLAVRPGGVLAAKAEARGVPVFPVHYGADLNVITAFKIRRFLARERVEIVCTNFEKENRLTALATIGRPRPVMVSRKGLPFIFDKWRYRVIYRHWIKHIVTPSSSIKRQFREYTWLDHVGISIIHNGVDMSDYPRGGTGGKLRVAYGVSSDTPLLGFVGDLARQKGVDVLLKALSGIDEPWHLLIVGDGGERAKLEALCDELRLRDRATFTGHRDDVPEILSELDMLVSPSLFEGMPNAVLEAMAAGKPVVAGAVDGVVEVVTCPDLGVLVEPGDVGRLRAAVSALLEDPERRRRLGESARDHVARNFTVKAMVDRLERLFVRLLEEAGADA